MSNYILEFESPLKEIEYKHLLPIEIAIPLYVSLICDTGSFKYSNTTSRSHLMASHLIESGVKPAEITKHGFESRKLLQIQLMSDALNE